MEKTNKTFTQDEIALLKSIKNATLDSIDACIIARDDMAWNTVRLHLGAKSYDLNNLLGKIVVDEFGTLDEFGLMSITESDGKTLDIPEVCSEITVTSIDKRIRSVGVINDIITVFGDGVAVAEIRYPQAVILDLGDESLVLDKEVWFSETITIKRGSNPDELIYDDSPNWTDDPEEDPTTHYSVEAELVEL